MADGDKKAIKAMVKEQTREALEKAKVLRDKLAGKSKMHPVAGAAVAVASGMAFAYIDGRAASDANKHPASLIGIGAGVVTTIAAEVAGKPSWAHAAADATAGPAIWVLASAAHRKGMEHATAPKTTKAPASAQPAG